MSGTCKGRVPNTPLCIDDFHPSNITAFLDTPLGSSCQLLFFLSHMHGDHTRGLSSSWQHGHIYTTHINRHLLLQRFSLPHNCITALHYNTPTIVPLSPHCPHLHFTLTLLPVYHCPGACMLVLDGYWGRVVYTGDMRWLAGSGLGGEGGVLLSRAIDVLYLDNTYQSERYQRFMSREQVVDAVVDVIAAHGGGEVCDVLINSDLLGKEDVLVMVARRCRCLIAVDEDKYGMLRALHEASYDLNDNYQASAAEDDEWLQREEKEERKATSDVSETERLDAESLSCPSWFYRFTTNRAETFLHVVPKRLMTRKHVDELNEQRSRDHRRPLVAVHMTGWNMDAAQKQQLHTTTTTDAAVTDVQTKAGGVVSETTLPSASCKRHPLSPLAPSQYCSGDDTHPCNIHSLPYSSHSSYSELQSFLSHVRPRSIQPISSPLTPTALYSAFLDPTPPTAFTVPAELLRTTLKDAEWMRRERRPAGHLQMVRRRRSEGWLGSKRRRTFALSGADQVDEPLTAREAEYLMTDEENEVDAQLDLEADDQPSSMQSQRTEINISSLSSDEVQLMSPPAASSFCSLDDPIRHFSLRINPTRRHLMSQLSLTDFHNIDVPLTAPVSASPPSRFASGSSAAVTTLAAHTASLPIRRLPAFLSSIRRDSHPHPIRPPQPVTTASQPILHPSQLMHPWNNSLYRSSDASLYARHRLPLCAAQSTATEPESATLYNVTSAVNDNQLFAEESIGVAVNLHPVSCSGSMRELSDMPPLEPA